MPNNVEVILLFLFILSFPFTIIGFIHLQDFLCACYLERKTEKEYKEMIKLKLEFKRGNITGLYYYNKLNTLIEKYKDYGDIFSPKSDDIKSKQLRRLRNLR